MGKYQGKHSVSPGKHAAESAAPQRGTAPGRREIKDRPAPSGPEAQEPKKARPERAGERPARTERPKAGPAHAEKEKDRPARAERTREKPTLAVRAKETPARTEKAKSGPAHAKKETDKPVRPEKTKDKPVRAEKPKDKPARAEKAKGPAHAKKVQEPPARSEKAKKKPAPSEKAKSRKAQSAKTPEPGKKRVRPEKKKRSKKFLFFMLFYILALLIGTGYVQHRLWNFLGSSQAEMDRSEAAEAARKAHEKAVFQAPQLAFEDWESQLTTDYWTDLWYAQSPNDLDIRENVFAYMQERFAPDALQAYRAAGFTQEAPVYVLKNGGESLARVTLSGSELEWEVSDVELLFEGTYSTSVTVPRKTAVFCNGQELGEEFRQETDSLMTYKLLDDKLKKPVYWYKYTVDGLLTEPELTMTPPKGADLLPCGEDSYLLLRKKDNNSVYAEQAVHFVQVDLEYYMNGARGAWGNMSRVLGLLRQGTQAYEDTRKSYEGLNWSTHYSNIDTSKTTVGDVITWANNCFSVDVTYDADCTHAGKPVDYANATMRIYFLRDGDEYFISNFETL